MHLHILGICGTFMGSLALIARELGHKVSGSDENVYPPMSTQLEQQGITLTTGYSAEFLQGKPDLVIVGNAMSRGNPAVEAVLDCSVPYCSGPEWLRKHVLEQRWVLAVAGTHGKTTTSSMLAKILDSAGLSPGFLIGGIAQDFGISARVGDSEFFVIEADEYDSAFFDKRSKFIHYGPRTVVLANLEFDHADIFADLAAIQTQFHHLVRTIPATGCIVMPEYNPALDKVIEQGCWTPIDYLATSPGPVSGGLSTARWQVELIEADGSVFRVRDTKNNADAIVRWQHIGAHNVSNGLAAIAAAAHVNVSLDVSAKALSEFIGVKRRMEKLVEKGGVTIYDDFAHHPTAIKTTLLGLRKQNANSRIVAIIEPRSNTMRMGVHADALQCSVVDADWVIWYKAPGLNWDPNFLLQSASNKVDVFDSVDAIIESLIADQAAGDQWVLMSNGAFAGIHQRLTEALLASQV